MNPSENLRHRSDLSKYLFHFTKGENPIDIIRSITEDKKLKSSTGVICFTEQPLIMCSEMLAYMQRFPKPMYQPYGIGFKRDLMFRLGARPVIYSTAQEGSMLPPQFQWRFLELDPDAYDFSWMREWRLPMSEFDFSNLSKDNIILVGPSIQDEASVAFDPDYDVDFDYDSETRTCIPRPYVCGASRSWRYISLERVVNDKMNDYMVDASIYFEQHIGEDYDLSIGNV